MPKNQAREERDREEKKPNTKTNLESYIFLMEKLKSKQILDLFQSQWDEKNLQYKYARSFFLPSYLYNFS